MDCDKCDPTAPVAPPNDCLFTYNASGLNRLETVASQLCVDGGSQLPTRGCSGKATENMTFCDATASLDDRVEDLVQRLTVSEIASGVLAMVMVPTQEMDGTPINHNLRQTAGVPRLGIPPFTYNEAMHGINALCLANNSCPTMFPNQISQTAAFNRSLWRVVATALGREGRALKNAGLDAANFWAVSGQWKPMFFYCFY